MQDAWFYQVKAAQRDLIKMAGGLDRTVEITSFARSVVGRWNNPADGDLMPLTAVRALEKETGQPLITAIMAHETGRKILEPNGPVTEAAALEQMIRQMFVDVAELGSIGTLAAADNHITPAEGTAISNPLDRIATTARRLQQLIGAVKAAGGASADLRLVQGE
jgi:hypothetical protein